MNGAMGRRDLLLGAACASAFGAVAPGAMAAPAAVRLSADAWTTGPATVSELIARFVAGTRYEDLPSAIVEKAKEQLVFFVGRAFEGCQGDAARQIDAVAPSLSRAADGGATVIGGRYRLAPSDAAFANCSLMRGDLGYDDVLWPAGIHAGVITLPPALALCETRRMSGRDLILAVALGYEVMGKLGRAANGWETAQPRRPTNIYGAFGPAVVAGKLLGLSERQLAHLMGYAVNVGLGIPEGGMAQHYYSFVARSGVLSAELVAAGGVSYSRTTLEGDLGLYRSFFGEVPASLPGLIAALGKDWELARAEQKRFIGTGANAVAISQLIDLMRAEHLTAEDIASVSVRLPFARRASARREAIAARGPFSRQVDAYSSLPYALALTVLFGRDVAPRWYAADTPLSTINDPRLLSLMQRASVDFEARESLRYSRLLVRTRDGRDLVRETDTFEIPFPRHEWAGWMAKSGLRVVGRRALAEIESGIADLEHLENVAPLVRRLA